MTDKAEFDRLFEQARARLRGARQSLEAGTPVDLGDLEGLVSQIAALPRNQGQTFRNALLALYDDLERLGTDLVRHRDRTAGQLKTLTSSGRVAAAYSAKPTRR